MLGPSDCSCCGCRQVELLLLMSKALSAEQHACREFDQHLGGDLETHLITQVLITPVGYITHLCKRLTSAADSCSYASLQAYTAEGLAALDRSWSAA